MRYQNASQLNRTRWFIVVFFFFGILEGLALRSASAQERSDNPKNEPPVSEANLLTIESVQTLIQQLKSDLTLDSKLVQSLLQVYEAIQVELRSKSENERLAKELATSAEAAPAATTDMKRRKESPPARDLISESALRSYQLQALQELLQTQKTNLQTAIDARTKAEADITSREARKKDLPRSIAEERAKLLDLNEKLATPATTQEQKEPRLREAETLLLRSQIAALTERIRKREQELRVYEAENELLTLRKSVFSADERYYLGRVKEIVDELNKRRETKIEEEKVKVAALVSASPLELSELSKRLMNRVNDWLDLAKRNTAIELAIEQSNANFKKWEERNRIMTDRSQSHSDQLFGVINNWNGLLLRRHRSELPDESKLQKQLNEHLDRMQQTETLIIDMEDWKNQDSAAQLDIADFTGIATEHPLRDLTPGLSQQADKLLAAEREVVTSFTIDAKEYSDNLYTLSESKQATIRLIRKYRAFIDQHILWIRSAKPFGSSDLSQVWPATQNIFLWKNWRNAAGRLLDELQRKIWQPVLFCLIWSILVFNTSKMRRAMSMAGEQAERSTQTNFWPTAKAIFFTLLLSAPWPALLLFIGYRLHHADAPKSFPSALGMGCMVAARYFYTFELIRQVCRRGGLAESHFEWSKETTYLLRRHLRWLIDLGVPSAAICGLLYSLEEARFEHSLGRLAFAFLMVLLALFVSTVLRPTGGVFRNHLLEHPGGWADRLRYVWYFGLSFGPLLLCFNSLSGYHYTAVRLSMLWHTSVATIVGLFLLYQIVRRWLLLSRRKIMTDQARQRLEEVQFRETTGATISSPNVINSGSESRALDFSIGSEQVDLAAINAQTLRLSISVLVVAAIIAMVYIWSGVLPAVNVLNSITLWTVQGATPSEQTPITLASLLWAIPIVVLTFIGARNLPGLLEIALLQQLPFQKSVRYAIATLSRYAIVMLGIGLTFNSIGVRWANIQWLVAALGVGLGFGLQEIFGNFVSGLILLFEQPIRVGDVITIGETTGSVSRIRMRATTITNWDRQELVIPNKDLITGRLLNWTLSDSTNRVVMSVGISYASDPTRACELIQEICETHENVLNEPEPTAHLDSFGDSTINLKIRLFLENLDVRVQTRHELQTQILQRFAEEGIEISFPQRDLHIRSLPKALADFLTNNQPKP
jgi:potassium-dependent mechanosensitive channel